MKPLRRQLRQLTPQTITDGGRLSTIPEERSTELNTSDNDSALIEFTNLYFADADIEDIRPIFETLQIAEDNDDDEGDNDPEWCFPVTPDTHISNADMSRHAINRNTTLSGSGHYL